MPTRIVMANGEHLTVTEPIETVAEQLGGGSLTRFDRPWGDAAIYVNPSEIVYLEEQAERAPDIEAMQAVEAAPPPAAPAPGAPGGPAAGTPGGPAVQPGGPAPGTPGGPPIQPR